jgi:hypothetical protein
LSRFALAQGDVGREWVFRTVLGARLLDVMLPGPAGVALDAGSDEGMLFPPVEGVVPEAAVVDLDRKIGNGDIDPLLEEYVPKLTP